jgi:3-oxoacyl-[acyl-carrier protein] reductase
MGKYESINIGDKAEISHKITKNDIEAFVNLTGDDNKLHVNPDYASKTSMKKPVVHGMLGASFISTLIGTKLPGDGSMWFSQTIEFILPAREGDVITVKAEVIKKIDRDKIIELQTDIFNQNKQKITTGIAKIKVIEQIITEKDQAILSEQTKRTVLLIGSTGGIGNAVAKKLSDKSYNLALHYFTNKTEAFRLCEEFNKKGVAAKSYQADITKYNQVASMVENIIRDYDKIDCLINCSTIKIPSIKFVDLEWDDFQKQIDINIKGAFNLCKALIPAMRKRKFGKIINIVTQAIETPNAEWSHYITAKSGLSGFSKALAVELAPKGITVNMISPGMTETELIADIPEKARLLAAAKSPMRRIAKPEDIAGAVNYLLSDDCNYMTGETIRINGGQVML